VKRNYLEKDQSKKNHQDPASKGYTAAQAGKDVIESSEMS
jgi:hypothetical protein